MFDFLFAKDAAPEALKWLLFICVAATCMPFVVMALEYLRPKARPKEVIGWLAVCSGLIVLLLSIAV